MTKRQWVWLWIWILTFFFIFCMWSKLQNLHEESRNKTTITKVATPIKKELSFKIIKDDQKIKIIALLPNEESAQKIIKPLKKFQSNIDRSEITIDDNTHDNQILDQISILSKNFTKLQSGYIEYGDHKLILDGITNNQNIKDELYAQALKMKDVDIENKIFINDIESIEDSIKNIDNTISSVEIKIDNISQDKNENQQKSISEIQAELDAIVAKQKVEFKYGTNSLTYQGKNTVDKVLKFLKKYPNIKVEIGGHTDSDGLRKSNKILSQKRADFIQAYFIDNDIQSSRLTSVGYGETQNIVPNDSLENKQKNRRVEFKIIGIGEE